MIKFIVLCNPARRLTKARKPAFITRIHYQMILDRASMSCCLWKALTFHWVISSATSNASPDLVCKLSRGKSLMNPRYVTRSTLPSYNSSTVPCPLLSPLAPGSCTLPHCQETCSKNPWHLLSRCKEKVLQKLKLRTRNILLGRHSPRNIWYSSVRRLSVGWEEWVHFWFWREVNYSVLLGSYFRKLDCTTVTVS